MSIRSALAGPWGWSTGQALDREGAGWSRYPLLLLFAMAVDLLTPFLIAKGGLPGATRWLSDLTVALLLMLGLLRMLYFNRIPGAFLFLLALSSISIAVATLEGQQAAATAWGWWVMFRYPLLALYAYLQPAWPKNIAEQVVRLCVGVLIFEVLFQLVQFASGQIPGDDLAGSFGRHGVGELMGLTTLVLALAWGRWLVDGNWRLALLVTILGIVSSVLGEIKFYPVAMVTIIALALLINGWRTRRLTPLVLYSGVLAVLLVLFALAYNLLVAEVRSIRPIQSFLDWEQAASKLNVLEYDDRLDIYRFGRGLAVTHAWETIQADPVTLLFGLGIGARSESTALGIRGIGYQRDGYGLTSSPSSLTFIQELGVVGNAAVIGFFLWMALRLLRFAARKTLLGESVLATGLAIFTVLWPLWIVNHDAWGFSFVSTLYWASIGLIFSRMNHGQEQLPPAPTAWYTPS